MNETKKCPRDFCLYATTVPEYNYCPICGRKLEIIDGTAYKDKLVSKGKKLLNRGSE